MKASVAQWIEHPPPKGRVVGSIPTGGAKLQVFKFQSTILILPNFNHI